VNVAVGTPVIRNGLLIVHTGNGKGKTTAALGLAVRSACAGYRVRIFQFIKGQWKPAELELPARFAGIEITPLGQGFTWEKSNKEDYKTTVPPAWKQAAEAIGSGKYDVVILDEVTYIMKYGYVATDEVIAFLSQRPRNMHIVCTGRGADPRLIEIADLVTEMVEIKHPYKSGVKAQRGIEY
jgi:cob(I)alamin adenosyltransferase